MVLNVMAYGVIDIRTGKFTCSNNRSAIYDKRGSAQGVLTRVKNESKYSGWSRDNYPYLKIVELYGDVNV